MLLLAIIIVVYAIWADDIAQVQVESNFLSPAERFYPFWTWHKAMIVALVVLVHPLLPLVAWGVSHIVFQVQVNRRREVQWWNMSNSPGDESLPSWDGWMLKLAGGREKLAAIISITLGALTATASGGAYIWL